MPRCRKIRNSKEGWVVILPIRLKRPLLENVLAINSKKAGSTERSLQITLRQVDVGTRRYSGQGDQDGLEAEAASNCLLNMENEPRQVTNSNRG